jgi:divalent metal cation (Fe/Co/Zn/Cd) transporter
LAISYSSAILAVVQLYRYRRVSSPIERQQTKWVVFGIAVPTTVFVGGSVLYLIFPALAEPSSPYGAPYQLALAAVNTCLPLFIPLSFGFAMLRYRLWEIDVLINRTLVYSMLTVILAGVYVGLVIGLQALLRGIISQDNSVAIVISTLAIAALFQPLRQRLQKLIDRRFYRSKYDAARTVAAFNATLRQEVDLDQLREHLLAVVQETMQPAHVSLWLRQPERPRQPRDHASSS